MSSLPRLTLLLLFAAACSTGREPPENDSAKADDMAGMDMTSGPVSEVRLTAQQIRLGGIAWRAVTFGTSSASAVVPGQLVPNEDRTARLGAPAGGRIVAVRVRPGDRVARGQVLVTMQSPEAGRAQSDLATAQADIVSRRAEAAYAKSARDRAERLLALKAIPRQEYERAIADDELARSALAQAEAELTRARTSAVQLGAAASASGEIALRSPLAGVVLARTAVPGTVVEAGAPLVVVTDVAALWLEINAPEKLAGLFRVGSRLRFHVAAYPDESFVARVDAVGAGLDPASRTLPVRGVVANSSRRLKPEMLATVDVEGAEKVAAILVPEDAVQLLDDKSVVFLAHTDSAGSARFTPRLVELGARSEGRVAILRGIVAGDTVVTHGALTIKAEFKKGSSHKMEM